MPEMKSYGFGILIVLLAIFSPARDVQARAMKSWTWKKYRVKFKLPADWQVTKNSATAFIAKGPGVVFKIGPWQGRNGTAKSVAEKAFQTYRIVGSRKIIGRKMMSPGTSGLNRYMIFGEGKYAGRSKSRGRPVRFGIIGMTNPRSALNLYARTWWFNDQKDARRNNRMTYRVATSLRAY